ncbi:hypothetical protein [Caballeronia sp. NCTM1]|uniref:hypothetical protein n=1 Tax=Caballeronia sp. NCTM1 TaxID=2921753 RepID=UPI002027CFB2|nr:hypothetical protein [Caballeronia sp. NCTM1]
MKPQTVARTGLLRAITAFRPQQSPVARKNLPDINTLTASVPQSVFMSELREAGDAHLCPVAELIEINRQVQIAEKVADMYVLLRELDLEWPRFQSMFPDAAGDWLQLLVNRARVLRDEIDEISHANRN